MDGQYETLLKALRAPGESARPKVIAVSHDGRRVCAVTGRSSQIVAFEATTWSVRGPVQLGARPWGLTLTPDGRHLNSANAPSDDVAVIVTEPLQVETAIFIKRTRGIAVMRLAEH
jgi:DNA-binding beta-propeller fold protein YncE